MSASPIHMSNRFALPNGIASAVMERLPTGNSDAIATPPPRANGHASGSGTYGPSSTPQIDHNATPGPSTAPLPTPATATPNGNAPTDKPEKKRKKKGWKGWAMVIEDAQGNVLEINDGPPPAPLPSRRDKIKQEEESVLQDTPEPVVNNVKSPTPYIARYETNGASPEPLFQSNSKKARAARAALKASGAPHTDLLAVNGSHGAKRSRSNSYSTTPQPSAPADPVPKTANAPGPRHSLPQTKSARAAHNKPLSARRLPLLPPKPAAPVDQPVAPIVSPAAPVIQPAAPIVLPPAPIIEPVAPVVEPVAPVIEPSAPEAQPAAPIIRPPAISRQLAVSLRQQPRRAESRPHSGRATPIPTPIPTVEERPAQTLQTHFGPERPVESHVQDEAAMLIANAAKHRKPSDPQSAAPVLERQNSTTYWNRPPRPAPPPAVCFEPGYRYHDSIELEGDDVDDADDEESFDDFDAAFEKVQEAYRNGIRPINRPDAPRQERSVPIFGVEDAESPEWVAEQGSKVVIAPRKDRPIPKNDAERAHRDGFEGLTPMLASDAAGFMDNVKENLRDICAYHLPQDEIQRDAFVEAIGRALIAYGWELTDSSVSALPPSPPPRQ